MLSMHVKNADARKEQLKPQFVAGEKHVIKAAEAFTNALLTATNEHVSTAYTAEREIESELRSIERLLVTASYQTSQWTSLIDRLSTQLKEMGDLTNWLEQLNLIAADIQATATSLYPQPS